MISENIALCTARGIMHVFGFIGAHVLFLLFPKLLLLPVSVPIAWKLSKGRMTLNYQLQFFIWWGRRTLKFRHRYLLKGVFPKWLISSLPIIKLWSQQPFRYLPLLIETRIAIVLMVSHLKGWAITLVVLIVLLLSCFLERSCHLQIMIRTLIAWLYLTISLFLVI